MYVKSVSFRKNIQVANYQHEHVEVCIELAQGDSFLDALNEAKRLVSVGLGTDVTDEELERAKAVMAKAARVGRF